MSEHEQEPDESPEPTESPETPDDDDAEQEEQEHIDGPHEPAGEPEGDPEPHGESQAEAEARFKKAETSYKGYTRRVGELWGDEAETLIPVYFSPSAPPGFLSSRDAGRIPDEVKAPLMEWLGFAREQDYEPDPEAHECRTCKGKGKTATGSHVGGNETRDCPTCRGVGYEAPQTSNGHAPVVLDPAHVPAGQQPHALTEADPDMWGEPRILPDGRPNPNYGKMPSMKVTVPPYGVTAGLTAQDSVV